MMLLYAVTPATPEAETAAEPRLRAHQSEGLALLVEHRSAAPARTTHDLLAFAHVLETLWSQIPLLPVRFGTTADSDADLDELIAQHRSEWADRLAVVAGHSECIVHVPLSPGRVRTDDDEHPAEDGHESGAAYLRRRAREVAQHDSAAAGVRACLGPYAAEVAALPPVRPDEARLSFLVPDEQVEAARAAVLDWARTRPGVSFSGPWPPFSFCREVTM